MKIFSRILALVMAFCIISSCSILKGTSGNGLSNGLQTGLALLNMYNTIKQNKQVQQAQTQQAQQQATATATRGLDLSNASNLLNIAQILTGAGTLQNATPTYTNQFSNGLITAMPDTAFSSSAAGCAQSRAEATGRDAPLRGGWLCRPRPKRARGAARREQETHRQPFPPAPLR